MADLTQSSSSKWWSRVAVLFAKSTLFLILVGFSVAFLYFGFYFAESKPTLSSTLLGIGGSLSASLVFALLYSWIVDALIVKQVAEAVEQRLDANELKTNVQFEAFAERLAVTIDSVANGIVDSHHGAVLHSLPAFVPSTIYPFTQGSSPAFVEHVVRNMRNGSTYVFRGITGRHVATFLNFARPSHLSCTVLLLDPRRSDLLALYIRERFDIRYEDSERFNAKIKEIRDEILASVVGLFDVSRLVSVHLKLHGGPVYFRSEVFDDEAFLSIYAGSESTPYPWTAVFGKTSFVYQFLRKDSQECIAIRAQETTFSVTSDESDLSEFIAAIGGDPTSIPTYRNIAKNFDNALRRIRGKNE